MSIGIFQPRLQELGRIRTGEQVSTGKGGTRPHRLETFRLTSENKPRLHAVANLYGGEVTEWADAPTGRQWQVITDVNTLPVSVPPDSAISQAWEQWSGGGCQIRCDGEFITHAAKSELRGCECMCPTDPAERNALANKGGACQPVTRLSVLLYDVPGIGVWRLDTRGFYAGSELIAITPYLQQAAAKGQYLNCNLCLETRSVKRDGQTLVFPVVTLQPANATLIQLLAGQVPESGLIAPPQIPVAIAQESEEPKPKWLQQTIEEIGDMPVTHDAQMEDDLPPVVEGQLVDEREGQDHMLLLRDQAMAMARNMKMSKKAVAEVVQTCGGYDIPLTELTDTTVLDRVQEMLAIMQQST